MRPTALNPIHHSYSAAGMIPLYVHELPINATLVYPVMAPWILFCIGLLVFIGIAKVAGWSPQTTGGLILAGLANTSFLGLPMIETFYGASSLSAGILIDQLGTYMVLTRWASSWPATYLSSGRRRLCRSVIALHDHQLPAVADRAGAGVRASILSNFRRRRGEPPAPAQQYAGAPRARLGRISSSAWAD